MSGAKSSTSGESETVMGDRNDSDMMAGFGALIGAMSGGGDRGNPFPRSDADDFSHGARWIPGNVTLARREGKTVTFNQPCGPCCWYWEFEDGSRVQHWDPSVHQDIGRHNNPDNWGEEGVVAGPCPKCGNEHTNGGHIPAPSKTS